MTDQAITDFPQVPAASPPASGSAANSEVWPLLSESEKQSIARNVLPAIIGETDAARYDGSAHIALKIKDIIARAIAATLEGRESPNDQAERPAD